MACCGSRILRASVGIRLWMAHGRGIRGWDTCGHRRIRGAGCLTTMATGCLCRDLVGDGSLADGAGELLRRIYQLSRLLLVVAAGFSGYRFESVYGWRMVVVSGDGIHVGIGVSVGLDA